MRVLIADDHEVTRRGLRDILADGFGEVDISEADNGESILAQVRGNSFDLILLDIMMPATNVIEVLAGIRVHGGKVPVLVRTAATELEYVVQTLKAGANGLIHKHRLADELVEAIKTVLGGRTYLHPETAAAVAASVHAEGNVKPHEKLSDRELDVLRGIALGRAVKEVAGDLGISEKTVATYLARIREKTGLSSHVDIARYALRHRLVD